MAGRKRRETCVWMARKMAEWPSIRGPITKIMLSDEGAVDPAIDRARPGGKGYGAAELSIGLGGKQ